MFKNSFFIILSLLLGSTFAQAEVCSLETPLQQKVKQAIRDLVEDNLALAKSTPSSHFKPFVDIQNPRTTMVLCSDSRVQVDNISQGAENDIFVARDIGNQLVTVQGSVEYGVNVLKTPVLVFVGHSSCGAIKAAMGDMSDIPPAIKKELLTLDVKGAPDDKEGVVLNVHNQVDKAMGDFKDKVDSKELAIVGAVYDFRNDYGYGKGHLIIVNLNGKRDPEEIRKSECFKSLKDVSIGVKPQKKKKEAS